MDSRRGLKRSASRASLDSPCRAYGDTKRAKLQRYASSSDEEDNTFGPPRPFNPEGSSRTDRLPSRTDRLPSRHLRHPPHTRRIRGLKAPKTPVQTKADEAMTPAEDSGGSPVLVDSPNNPFVSSADPSAPKPKPREVTPVYEEKPTVTYVFRGKKIELINPLYNLPEEAFKNSRLPVEHKEYSPPPVVKPHRLFKEEMKSIGRGQSQQPICVPFRPQYLKLSPRKDTPVQPTVTYVFRGKRAEPTTPLYCPAAHEAIKKSRLAIKHGEYSPLAAKLQRLSCNEVRPTPPSPVPAHLEETFSGYKFRRMYPPCRTPPP